MKNSCFSKDTTKIMKTRPQCQKKMCYTYVTKISLYVKYIKKFYSLIKKIANPRKKE